MYQIELTKQAEKAFSQLLKSQPAMGRRVAHVLDELAKNPTAGVLLKGELAGLRKYRVGSYRIIYSVKHSKLLIIVIDIGHRREVYR